MEDKKDNRQALNKVLEGFASARASRDNVNFCQKNFEFANANERIPINPRSLIIHGLSLLVTT